MTTLMHQRVDEYLRLRRALGFRLRNDGRRLPQFADYLEQHGAATVTAAHAIAWAQAPQGVRPVTWGQRLTTVRGFAAWLRAIDPGRGPAQGGVPPAGETARPVHLLR